MDPDRGDPASRTLYERDLELRAAEAALAALCREREPGGAGIGERLVFVGAPGLGKTAVLTEIRRLARKRGDCTVLFARGGERQHNEPFHVVRQLLQPVLGALPPQERRQLLGHWHDIVGPAVGLVPPAGPLDPQGVRDGLDFVLSQLVARSGPLLAMVDDLHWADLESLGWLAAFTLRARELPVLLAFACREEFPEAASAFQQALTGQVEHRHELHPLNPGSVAELVRASLGETSEEVFCRQVWAVTGGNPYETTALLREVRDQRLDPSGDNSAQLGELASRARGVTTKDWLERLGPTVLRFAWAASMLGTDIDPDLAASICAQGPAAAAESVTELRRQRVLSSTANGRLEFVHPLIASAVYQSMPSGVRTGMHGVAATQIENAGLGLLLASRHLLETQPEGDPQTVLKLRRAAGEHLAIGAPEAAQRCLRRALSEPPPDRDRAELLFELGCSALLTSPASTVNQLRLALDDEFGLRPELRVDATFRLAQALAHNNQLAEAAASCAQEAARTPAGPGRVRLDVAHFMFATFQANDEDGPGRSRRLAALADSLGRADDAISAVLALRCWDLTLQGGPASEAVALADAALVDGHLPPSLGWTNTTWGFELPGIIGLSYLYADRLDQAQELFSEAVWAYETAGWSGGHLGFAHFLMGLLQFRRGNLREAEEYLRRALRAAERIAPGIPLQWFAVGVLIDTLLARGRQRQAGELAARYAFGPPYATVIVLPHAPTLYGRLLLAQGDRAGAATVLTGAGAALDGRGWGNTLWAPWSGQLALALAPEDPDRAAALAELALGRARRSGTDSAIAAALRQSAAVHGGATAVELLREAVHRLEHSPVGYEQAGALVDLGAALCGAGRAPEAREPLTRGLARAERCGADALVARARAALRGC
ncbi:ATP-binding protein [Kitasatospora sp. NBC_01266]|uniref:ATP-binding protein n=1 Tax=Kitasatospora sp. NBC_01266 TaxID=2903572 RepID=UPI002E338C9C|nr:AAA family ATPase [Kitasatospora sp. NBC_01266]